MVTISRIVEKVIERRPFLEEALKKGIINFAALSESLLPEVERELGQKAQPSAVMMALRRASEKLESKELSLVRFDRTTDITVKSDLIEITVYKSEDVQKYVKSLYDLVDLRHGDFLTITQGLNEIMIITNARYADRMSKIFPKAMIKKVIKGLSSITLTIPESSIETIGLFYLVTKALTWENINIIDIVSTLTEMTYIVEEKNTSRAFDVLKELTLEHKK